VSLRVPEGDLGRYIDRREAVLGGRMAMPTDPARAARRLVEHFGSEDGALGWLHDVLLELTHNADWRSW
jgi:hypothetical protein